MSWWGTSTRPSARMVEEVAAMKRIFNTKQPIRVNTNNTWDRPFLIETGSREFVYKDVLEPYWLIEFRMIERGMLRRKFDYSNWYKLRIQYKDPYPAKEPRVTLPEERIGNAPHIYNWGARFDEELSSPVLCLTGHAGIRSTEWDPGKSTAATVAVWAIEWIRAWNYWKRTDVWPEADEKRIR